MTTPPPIVDCRCELHRSGKHPLTPTYRRGDRVLMRVIDGAQPEASVDRVFYSDVHHAVIVFVVLEGEDAPREFVEADIAELLERGVPDGEREELF